MSKKRQKRLYKPWKKQDSTDEIAQSWLDFVAESGSIEQSKESSRNNIYICRGI